MSVDQATRPTPIEAPRAPDTESFRAFFDAEHDRLFGALYLITRRRDEAEELMQEAFLKVWERWDRVRAMDSADGYLYRVAMNEFRMRYRRARIAARIVPHAVRRGDGIEEAEARSDVARALNRLGPRERAALVLTSLLGYPAGEAADLLGVKESTVRSLAAHARASMHKVMGERDG